MINLPYETESVVQPTLDEQLDNSFKRQMYVLREISMRHTNNNNLTLCTKWLTVFAKTTKEEKAARNRLMTILQSQLNSGDQLAQPFTDLSNCNRDLNIVLREYEKRRLYQPPNSFALQAQQQQREQQLFHLHPSENRPPIPSTPTKSDEFSLRSRRSVNWVQLMDRAPLRAESHSEQSATASWTGVDAQTSDDKNGHVAGQARALWTERNKPTIAFETPTQEVMRLREHNKRLRRELEAHKHKNSVEKSSKLGSVSSNPRLFQQRFETIKYEKHVKELKQKLLGAVDTLLTEMAERLASETQAHLSATNGEASEQQQQRQHHQQLQEQQPKQQQQLKKREPSMKQAQKHQEQQQPQQQKKLLQQQKQQPKQQPKPQPKQQPKQQLKQHQKQRKEQKQQPQELQQQKQQKQHKQEEVVKFPSTTTEEVQGPVGTLQMAFPTGVFKQLYASLLEGPSTSPSMFANRFKSFTLPVSYSSLPMEASGSQSQQSKLSQCHYEVAVLDANFDAALFKRFSQFFDTLKLSLASEMGHLYPQMRSELNLRFSHAMQVNTRNAHLKRQLASMQCFNKLRAIFAELFSMGELEMWDTLDRLEKKFKKATR